MNVNDIVQLAFLSEALEKPINAYDTGIRNAQKLVSLYVEGINLRTRRGIFKMYLFARTEAKMKISNLKQKTARFAISLNYRGIDIEIDSSSRIAGYYMLVKSPVFLLHNV